MDCNLELLEQLTQTVGVSGDEQNIIVLLKQILSQYGETYSDALNNVYCTFGAGKHFFLDAHLDEIGFIVTDITSDGFIKFAACGGIDPRPLPACEVSVWGKEELKGVISTLPPHLQKSNSSESVQKISELSIDTGYSYDELVKLVSLGDRITFKKNFTKLLNTQISASCLDDRIGVYAILQTIERLKKLPCKITVMFSSQEEVGTRGAKVGAFGRNIDEAISVDVSFAYTDGCSKDECGEIGKGPMIGFSPILDKEISKELVNIAKCNNINYQCEIMSGKTGTNADVISISGSGIKTGLISIPEKYMHQSVEIVDMNDVNSVSDLICLYIESRVGESNA